MKQRYYILAATVVGSVAAACKPPVPLPPRPAAVNADSLRQDSIARALADSIRRAELARQQAEADSLRAAQEGNQEGAETSEDAMAVLRTTIYFAYDQASLTDAAVSALTAKVPVLQANPRINLLITGHTDSRGSSEYNIALGLRRAAMVKEWLILNGISTSRIEIMSMGEESPVVFGENEDAWSQNRRAEFQVMGGN